MTTTKCTYAFAGTYGHECGAEATMVGVRKTSLTNSGIFYARRCAICARIDGGENTGITIWEPFDPAVHVNDWNGTYTEKVVRDGR